MRSGRHESRGHSRSVEGPERDLDAEAGLARLRNLGPVSTAMLLAAGIRSPDALRELGAAEAFRRVLFARGGHVSTNLLWALEGALRNARWDQLDESVRQRLRAEVEQAVAP